MLKEEFIRRMFEESPEHLRSVFCGIIGSLCDYNAPTEEFKKVYAIYSEYMDKRTKDLL